MDLNEQRTLIKSILSSPPKKTLKEKILITLPRPGDADWDAANPVTSYKCAKCGSATKHNERYDAYYCEVCNSWNEEGCDDPNCEFCVGRPTTPSEATNG